MAIYTISDEATRFCRKAMIQFGGRWDSERKVWMFRHLADAADAAIELYLATRATPAMREDILSMIADGTAVAAWNHDPLAPFEIESLSRERALELIHEGRQVRRVLGVHPVEDLPSADPQFSPKKRRYHEFRERAFQELANRSNRGHRESLGSRTEYSRDEYWCYECREVRDSHDVRDLACEECGNLVVRR